MSDEIHTCLFCNIEPNLFVLENELAFAMSDGFPVTNLHSLIIPKRHVSSYFDLTSEELLACNELIKELKMKISESDPTVTAFNVGINIGKDAGQTIFHCHIHLIPRRKGDVPNPKGGVRHIIPGKGFY
jgi:diadenosine tetraphosphate (Ap4A) HIT family hydrolase